MLTFEVTRTAGCTMVGLNRAKSSRGRASLALALVALVMVAAVAPAWAETRIALVIGNSKYEHATTLVNPANDAEDMGRALEAAGFKVLLGLDLDRRGFEGKVREFTRALADADVAVLFYAGHAMQVGRINYLLPVDARLESDRDLEFETIRLELVVAQMELGREGRTSIVFLDACRDNPLSRGLARSMGTRSAALGRGLAQVQGGVGSFIAYSTQPDNVALDGEGRNSPFAGALVRHIASEGKPLSAVMIDVRRDVIAATKGRQVPWDHSALTGEFYFRPSASNAGAGADTALAARNRALEAELKARADVETTARLAVLRERVKDQQRAFAEARQRLTDALRRSSQEADPARRQQMTSEVLAAQRLVGQRQSELRQTETTIAELEARLAKPTASKPEVRQ